MKTSTIECLSSFTFVRFLFTQSGYSFAHGAFNSPVLPGGERYSFLRYLQILIALAITFFLLLLCFRTVKKNCIGHFPYWFQPDKSSKPTVAINSEVINASSKAAIYRIQTQTSFKSTVTYPRFLSCWVSIVRVKILLVADFRHQSVNFFFPRFFSTRKRVEVGAVLKFDTGFWDFANGFSLIC